MKIVCLSDTHLTHSEKFTPKHTPIFGKQIGRVPDGDVLVHAGDATWRGTLPEIQEFADWYSRFPHKHKIFVAGNHDIAFERDAKNARKILFEAGILYLQDSEVEIDGVTFYGSPWQPTFGTGWAFNLDRGAKQLSDKWEMIPGYTDVLITHGPPYGFGDSLDCPIYDIATGKYEPAHVGCRALASHVNRVKPRLHVCGHIHSAHGIYDMKHEDDSVTKVVNASICNEEYDPLAPPILIEI